VLDAGRVHPAQDRGPGVDQALDGQFLAVDAGFPEPGQPFVGVDLDEGVAAVRALAVMDQERLDVGDAL
jgi:hypothetical protein